MASSNPFHQGELELQTITGELHNAAKTSQIIKDTIPVAALLFLREQFIIWLGIEDHEKMLWALALTGSPGFINPNNGELLVIELDEAAPMPEQWLNMLNVGSDIGCLALELSSRRRLRINGVITKISKRQLHIDVRHAYPNCPKYIRKRELLSTPAAGKFNCLSSGVALNEQLKNIIARADTAFVASAGPTGADVSHRGGANGFIQCESNRTITVPDYKGNGLFNTLGNFKIKPVGGILIVDFDQSYFLQLTGSIQLMFDTQFDGLLTGGTNRYWQLEIQRWQLFQLQANYKWENFEYSPHNPVT